MQEKIFNFVVSKLFYGPILIVIGALIGYKIISLALNKVMFKGKSDFEKKRRNTLIVLFNSIMKYAVIIMALLMILSVYGIDTTSVLAGLGIAGVVIGLALQDALKDIIGGINIILENYYILGDWVRFNDFIGTVIEFGLKSTKIKSANGEVLVLSNRSVDKIINLSQKQAIITIEVPTLSECDNKKVRKALTSIVDKVKEYNYVEANGCAYLGIEKVNATSVVYAFKVKCKQDKQFELRRELLEMVKEVYDKENLKLGTM